MTSITSILNRTGSTPRLTSRRAHRRSVIAVVAYVAISSGARNGVIG